jgi:outer membrane protein TolC
MPGMAPQNTCIAAAAVISAAALIHLGCVSADSPITHDAAPRLAASSGQDGVRQLQEQYLEVLREIRDMTQQQVEAGLVAPGELHQARQRVLRAELEVAETAEARIDILEQLVELAREAEEGTAKLHELGRGSTFAPLNAKAARLEAEIELALARDED